MTYFLRNANQILINSVWTKGIPIAGYDPAVWRHDPCGHVIKFSDHGDTNSQYGWEIDHIIPSAKGGTDDIGNLQPLYWETNRTKGDTYPWTCSMAA